MILGLVEIEGVENIQFACLGKYMNLITLKI